MAGARFGNFPYYLGRLLVGAEPEKDEMAHLALGGPFGKERHELPVEFSTACNLAAETTKSAAQVSTAAWKQLKSEGIGLVGAVGVHRSRCHGLGFRKPDPGVELTRQLGLEVVRE
jgi:hypothetical protein